MWIECVYCCAFTMINLQLFLHYKSIIMNSQNLANFAMNWKETKSFRVSTCTYMNKWKIIYQANLNILNHFLTTIIHFKRHNMHTQICPKQFIMWLVHRLYTTIKNRFHLFFQNLYIYLYLGTKADNFS